MRSPLTLLPFFVGLLAVCGGSAGAEPGPPTPELMEPSPEIVESFTRSIQPLLLNRCATGGCHAGQTGHAPLLRRHNAVGQIDRELTLANIDALRRIARTPGETNERTAMLVVSHPGKKSPAPLSIAQMNSLRSWLVAASVADAPPPTTTAAAPNRFRDLLENARNPTPLWPPPQKPKGLIFKDDPVDEPTDGEDQ